MFFLWAVSMGYDDVQSAKSREKTETKICILSRRLSGRRRIGGRVPPVFRAYSPVPTMIGSEPCNDKVSHDCFDRYKNWQIAHTLCRYFRPPRCSWVPREGYRVIYFLKVRGNFLVEVSDHAVTLAGGLLQSFTVKDRHYASCVRDVRLLLENASGAAHAGSIRSQHSRKKIVRNKHRSIVHAIVRHQQPSRETLLNIMQPVTRRCLSNLHSLNYCVAAQYCLKPWSRS